MSNANSVSLRAMILGRRSGTLQYFRFLTPFAKRHKQTSYLSFYTSVLVTVAAFFSFHS